MAWLGLGANLAIGQDWQVYGADPQGSKYSRADQINRDNVTRLERAWVYRTEDGQGALPVIKSSGLQATPILLPENAGGSLVFCTAFNKVIALDPVTGEERWTYDPQIPTTGPVGRRSQFKCRGVAQWKDELALPEEFCARRLILSTADRRLISLDSKTGELCSDFAEGGVLDLTPFIDATEPATDTLGVQTSTPPTVIGNVIVLGSTVGSKFKRDDAPSGAVRAFDARSGALVWSFDPVPRDETGPAAQEWTQEALVRTGAANVWSNMAVDEARDLIFIPTSSPSPNFFGGTRLGDNRYSNSVVALKGATGEMVWHFQLVHHDVWDWDVPAQPILIDLERDGKIVPAVVQLTKQGFVFVFHRETGEPLFPIEERAVPGGGVVDDQLSATQPFPLSPPALVPQGITPDDAWGLTYFDRAACRQLIENAQFGPMFTPPSLGGTVIRPSIGGGSNWGGGAYDGSRAILVTAVQNFPYFIRLVPNAELDLEAAKNPMAGLPGGPAGAIKGTPYGVERKPLFSPLGAPCTAPPWFSLTAVDLSAGTIKWSVPLGTIEKLAPLPVPLKFGAPGMGGPIATAAGLVFIGAAADEKIRAFDIETGEELWAGQLPTAAMAIPMTYERGGRQFVVIAAGGHQAYYRHKISDHLVAFALPE